MKLCENTENIYFAPRPKHKKMLGNIKCIFLWSIPKGLPLATHPGLQYHCPLLDLHIGGASQKGTLGEGSPHIIPFWSVLWGGFRNGVRLLCPPDCWCPRGQILSSEAWVLFKKRGVVTISRKQVQERCTPKPEGGRVEHSRGRKDILQAGASFVHLLWHFNLVTKAGLVHEKPHGTPGHTQGLGSTAWKFCATLNHDCLDSHKCLSKH